MSIFVFISLFMPMMEMGLQGDIKSIEPNEIILCALWLPGTDKPLIKRLFVSLSALTPPINEGAHRVWKRHLSEEDTHVQGTAEEAAASDGSAGRRGDSEEEEKDVEEEEEERQ